VAPNLKLDLGLVVAAVAPKLGREAAANLSEVPPKSTLEVAAWSAMLM